MSGSPVVNRRRTTSRPLAVTDGRRERESSRASARTAEVRARARREDLEGSLVDLIRACWQAQLLIVLSISNSQISRVWKMRVNFARCTIVVLDRKEPGGLVIPAVQNRRTQNRPKLRDDVAPSTTDVTTASIRDAFRGRHRDVAG